MEKEIENKKDKKRKFTFKKFLLCLLIIVLLVIVFFFIKSKITNYQNKKFIEKIDKIQQEKTMNVIVEINPSIALVVKNDTIIDSYCLNEDCVDLLKKMNATYNDNINNQKFDKIINSLYENAQKYGYDTSHGINVSSSDTKVEALIENINDATFEYISKDEEQKTLDSVSDKLEKSTISKEEYNKKLLEELKKDSEYDKTYYCITENDEVKCYMKDFMMDIDFKNNDIINKLAEITIEYNRFKGLLNKFNFSYSFTTIDGEPDKSIKLNDGYTYGYGDSAACPVMECTNNQVLETIKVKNVLMPDEKASIALTGSSDPIIYIPFSKVDLLTKTFEKKDVIVITHDCPQNKVYYGID